MLATLGACLLGLLFGVRHALDPDHLAAVATLMQGERGWLIGLSWGIGHSLALLVVGIILAAFQAQMPPGLADGFELAVAVMLCFLGARAIARALRQADAAHEHAHAHGHPHRHRQLVARPLAVGIVHGLAGSGAITALVLAQLPGTAARLVYTALFGLGSVASMAGLSTIAGLALRRQRSDALRRMTTLATGALSAVLGVVWAVPILGRMA